MHRGCERKNLNSMDSMRGRVAIITGAGSGIGEETSYAFARLGVSVALVDMNADKLDKVKGKMHAMGVPADKVMTLTCDLSEETASDFIINTIIDRFGQIDILVNNAAFLNPRPFESLTTELVDRTYKVILRAPFFLCQKAFPHLKKTQGCIVNMSSVDSQLVQPASIDYCIVKAGVDHFTRCLAVEGAPHGIRVNGVRPGITRTSILDTLIPDGPREEMYKYQEKKVPIGRAGNVADMASGILFLASDAASYITGTSLQIDGGMALATPWNKAYIQTYLAKL